MNNKIILGVLLAFAIASCSPTDRGHENCDTHEGHDHSENVEKQDEHEEHNHGASNENQDAHDEIKFQYTVYTNDFELFAEADAFIVGEKANVLSHFSELPNFTAVEKGEITLTLVVNGQETKQTLSQPTRKGIYSFDIQPENQGIGKLTFQIANDNGTFEVVVPEVHVFANDHDAMHAAEHIVVSQTNTTVFTKEQSWKIEFATAPASAEPFGQIIKTTALVTSAQSNEIIITAKTNGIVLFKSGGLFEGSDVSVGQVLFTITASDFSDNNISVKYAEAKNNYEKASADYERAKELVKDKIVSEKEVLVAKNQFENVKAVYNNLTKNFGATGQTITSPQAGFIKQVFVKNGAYVEAGQPIAIVSHNKSLMLRADVPTKYASVLADINTATIRPMNENHTYTLEELNGKILSYGKAANSDNYLIPVNLEFQNNGSFVAGSFVEMYLKIVSNKTTLVIPTTSLLEEQGSFFVWVQVTPELFEKRQVFIGGTDGIKTEITQGMADNERVVTQGAMLIKLAQATGTLDAHSGHVH